MLSFMHIPLITDLIYRLLFPIHLSQKQELLIIDQGGIFYL